MCAEWQIFRCFTTGSSFNLGADLQTMLKKKQTIALLALYDKTYLCGNGYCRRSSTVYLFRSTHSGLQVGRQF